MVPPLKPTDGMLTMKEACELLRVHSTTLHRWEAQGVITPVRTPGGHRRWKRDDIERLREPQ